MSARLSTFTLPSKRRATCSVSRPEHEAGGAARVHVGGGGATLGGELGFLGDEHPESRRRDGPAVVVVGDAVGEVHLVTATIGRRDRAREDVHRHGGLYEAKAAMLPRLIPAAGRHKQGFSNWTVFQVCAPCVAVPTCSTSLLLVLTSMQEQRFNSTPYLQFRIFNFADPCHVLN